MDFPLEHGIELKSVHFKNTVARSLVLSKLWSLSPDFALISADVILKMITILKELRIVQLCSQNERTLRWTRVDGNKPNIE